MSSEPTTRLLPSSYRRWFRGTFIGIGALEVFFAFSTMLQGVSKLMSQFGIPDAVVSSPHYQDAMFWVVLHMGNIGIICICLGLLLQDPLAQLWFPRVFVLFHSTYAFLDIRASDSPLGTGLYQGPASLMTPIISSIMLAAMLHLAIRSLTLSSHAATA